MPIATMQKYDPRDLAVKIAKIDNHFTGDTDAVVSGLFRADK